MANEDKDRDLCCCCIKLRPAIAVISLIYLAIIGATSYQKYSANDVGDNVAKTVIYVSCGLQVIIALLGLLSAATKSVKITTGFSYSWWILTLIVLGLSIVNIVYVAKNDRTAIEDECRRVIKPSNGIEVTDSEVYNCYRTTVVVSAVVLGIQFLIMCVIGWIINRFLREVKQDAAIAAALKGVDNGEA
ncbi:hypothetical protein BGZ76_005492 [Entomortierella beljakovae]|nr:hypothetical protein BGZ76_005492 [Entomortierella beljakovae]